MNQRQDLTLSTLILASMTAYGFLLVWAQNDTIELTTMGDAGGPMSAAGFTIVSGGNVSIELPPWHSTSIVPAVTTMSTGSPPTAAASLSAATMSPPNRDTSNREGSDATDTTTSGAGGSPAMTDANVSPAMTDAIVSPAMTDANVSPATTHRTAGNSIPRSMKTTRDANNFTGRVSLRVKIQSSAERDAAMEMFLDKACRFFLTLSLEDVTVTLGPDRTPMMCLKDF